VAKVAAALHVVAAMFRGADAINARCMEMLRDSERRTKMATPKPAFARAFALPAPI
jgi:hypothetical protein